jgi:hypothetical protein
MVSIASGAPVNCGTECTIVQNAKMLTLSRVDQPGTTPPDVGVVVLNLDGSDSTISQSNGAEYTANAKSDGAMLIVTRDRTRPSVTQTLSMVDGRLKVVTKFSAADAPVTLTYVRSR